jgi:hypothetical protein
MQGIAEGAMAAKRNHNAEKPLEDRIKADEGARKALDKLLACPGMNRDELWFHLTSIEYCRVFGFARWEQRSTLTRKQAKKLAQKVRSVRDEIGAFLVPRFHHYLTVEWEKYLWLNLVQKHLTLTAAFIEAMLQASDNRRDDETEIPRRQLTDCVLRACGRPHDSEVANLIAVVLGRAYTFEDQRKFRTRQRKTGHN